MTIHYFTAREYKEVLSVYFYNYKNASDLEYLTEIFNGCKHWENKICAINYFLSLAIEKIEKERKIDESLIDYVYSLEERMNFDIQEVSREFISALFEHYYSDGLSIEETLIEVLKVVDG